MKKYFYYYIFTALANTMFICREQLPTLWEILFMIPLNVVYPFFYVMDIVKDLVQFMLLLVAVGGLPLVLKNWNSFSSTVSKYTFFGTLFFGQQHHGIPA